MADYKILDSDGHIIESVEGIRKYIDPKFNRPRLFGGDTWDRNLHDKLGANPQSPEEQLDAMDQDGVDVAILYPSALLSLAFYKEPGYALALSQAYNSWLHNFCQANPDRLKFSAVLAPQDAEGAAKELRRSITELGAVGGMVPINVPQRPDWSHTYYDPIYAEAQDLDVALSYHPGTGVFSIGNSRFDNFINVHTIDFPVENMIALCSAVVGGVLERFPTLRLAFLESGIGWVPYMMDRLDEEVEKRGEEEAPWLTMKPSEYIKSGRCYFGVECGEKTIPDAIRTTGDDCVIFASDYPHWDADWPYTVSTAQGRQDLMHTTKRKWMHDNIKKLYKLEV